MNQPNKQSTFPLEGTPVRGPHAGYVADGKGAWITVSQYEREEKKMDARHAEWLAQQGRPKEKPE